MDSIDIGDIVLLLFCIKLHHVTLKLSSKMKQQQQKKRNKREKLRCNVYSKDFMLKMI